MSAYYNEIDPYAAQWLRNLIAAGLIAPGDVDTRSIAEVQLEDVARYTQCHFFAGIGGWSYAARLAGWPDERPLWTGSCPCQPFSVAGRGKGIADERHLWPDFYRLIRGARPAVVMGEQVAGEAGYAWLDGVLSDLEAEAYSGRAVDIPACSVNAPHIRNRLYWVADAADQRYEWSGQARGRRVGSENGGSGSGSLGNTSREGSPIPEREALLGTRRGSEGRATAEPGRAPGGMEHSSLLGWREGRPEYELWRGRDSVTGASGSTGFWDIFAHVGPDPTGKYRRVKPGVRLLAHGVPSRVGKLRGFGNAIDPRPARAFIEAWLGGYQ